MGWVERETVVEALVWTGGLSQNTPTAGAILQHSHKPQIHHPQSCRAPVAGAPSTAGSRTTQGELSIAQIAQKASPGAELWVLNRPYLAHSHIIIIK